MDILKDGLARDKIETLERQVGLLNEEVQQLKRDVEDRTITYAMTKTIPLDHLCGLGQCASFPIAVPLTAKEILERFNQIYEALGMERKEIPQTPAKTVLAKKGKVSTQKQNP